MKHLKPRHLALLAIPLFLGGCQLVGAAGSLIGSLLSLALYLAAVAAPILLSYYLYHREHL
jgi:hypothetical protein